MRASSCHQLPNERPHFRCKPFELLAASFVWANEIENSNAGRRQHGTREFSRPLALAFAAASILDLVGPCEGRGEQLEQFFASEVRLGIRELMAIEHARVTHGLRQVLGPKAVLRLPMNPRLSLLSLEGGGPLAG